MLDSDQRYDRYIAQTGRTRRLTPRQHRRINHKIGHQSQAAALTRQDKATAKQAAAEARALRRANPLAR